MNGKILELKCDRPYLICFCLGLFVLSGCKNSSGSEQPLSKIVQQRGFHCGLISKAFRSRVFAVNNNELMFRTPPRGKQKPLSYYRSPQGKRSLGLSALNIHAALTMETHVSGNLQNRENWLKTYGDDLFLGLKQGLTTDLSPKTTIEQVGFSYGWLSADAAIPESRTLSSDRAKELLISRRFRFSAFPLAEDIEAQVGSREKLIKIQKSYETGYQERVAMGSITKDPWLLNEAEK